MSAFKSPAELLTTGPCQLGSSAWVEIDQQRVNTFAGVTGDDQWIHVDPIRAAAGPFGAPIAHGYLTLALAPVMLGEVAAVDGITAAVNYGLNRVRFPAAVPVGSRVRGHVSFVGASRRGPSIEAVYGLTVEVEGGRRPACVAECVVLYS